MLKLQFFRGLFLLILITGLTACQQPGDATSPVKDNDGWEVTTAEDAGLDSSTLAQMHSKIEQGTYKDVHSVLIVRDGKLAYEVYFAGNVWLYEADEHRGEWIEYDRHTTHNLASVTKSVTSLLFGTAVDQGFIEGVDQPVMDYFPQYQDQVYPKANIITLHDMLIMAAGLEWDESSSPYSSVANDLIRLFYEDDPIEYILTQRVVSEPGTRFEYSGGCTNTLAEVVRAATGQRIDVYSGDALFAPLGITNYEWDMLNADVVHASGSMFLRPRDMAKLGQLVLAGGQWQGEQIVSPEWIEQSVTPHITAWGDTNYGYQWWLESYNVNSEDIQTWQAKGWGGQRIIVIPDYDAVVVFTGGNYVSAPPCDTLMHRFILPAMH